jgi:condensin complex subunit 2
MSALTEIDSNLPNLNSLVLCSDDDDDDYEEDEDYDTAIGIKPRNQNQQAKKQQLYFDDDEDDYEDDKENHVGGGNDKRKAHPDSVVKPKKTSAKTTKKTPNPQPRKRRRSSARFLRLSDRFDNDDDEQENNGDLDGIELVGGETEEEKQAKLGEMYRRAIRLNAENKINGGNSWGLNLIDNIDKFLCDENDDDVVVDTQRDISVDHVDKEGGEKGLKRVNFTKASCTLDASVKIYSYRVDDVHLTSYKVLANLNRTDGGKQKNQDLFNDGGVAIGDDEPTGRRSLGHESRKTTKQTAVETIETNLCEFQKSFSHYYPLQIKCFAYLWSSYSFMSKANINVSKLDAAYDIDPIFHKMSQKFDEGGAKGLLLVNLGVASDGCRIILDSKEDTEADTESHPSALETETHAETNVVSPGESEAVEQSDTEMIIEEGEIDIFEISNKLQELLLCSPLESIQLVPQLEELRSTYAALEAEGFSDQRNVKKLNVSSNVIG